jgi:hypothetical protein
LVKKSCGHAIYGLIEENQKKKVNLIIIERIENPRIKMKKMEVQLID